jgi:hypothetical protein
MNDVLQVDLPVDYEYYTKIGVVINGQIWTLTRNNDIALQRKRDDCGNEELTTSQGCVENLVSQNTAAGFYYAPAFRNGQYVGEKYSMGGGLNELGFYRIDVERNRIQFASVMPKTQIVMEYKSNGVEKSGSTVIPSAAIAPIRAGIHWQLAEFDKTVGAGEKERLRQMYYNEVEKLKFFSYSFTMDEYLDATYHHIYSSVKR